MKTYVYIRPERRIDKNGFGRWIISASGRCPSNCDAVCAIGRSAYEDEIAGCGTNKKEAYEDAISSSCGSPL